MPTPILAPLTAIRPLATDSSGAEPPDNSELRKIGEDILGALKYSFSAVAARPDASVRSGSVEEVFQKSLRAMSTDDRQKVQKTAAELVNAPAVLRTAMFGRAGTRDAESHLGGAGGFGRYNEGVAPLAIDRKLLGVRTPTISVAPSVLRASAEGLLIPSSALPSGFESFASDFEEAAESAEQSNVMSAEHLEEIWGPEYETDPYAEISTEDEFEEFAVTDKMGFWITKVKCVDETNPEFWGHDEIALAGVSVDETGDTKKIPEKYIGGGFDDGDSKSYSNWRYHWFSLREGTRWPKKYVVTMILAEKDHGGLSSFLNDVYAKVRDKVKEAIAKAVASALAGYVGQAIANAIGQVVAWIVDVFVKWIINLFKDDIFPAFVASVTTPSMSARWHYPNGTWGNPSSGIRTAHFYGFGGHYYVQYFWKFFA